MAEQEQTQMRMVRPVAPRPAVSSSALTPKEVFGILRRHILLMVSMTILGFIIGGAGWYLLLRYLPKYTAETHLRVLAPVETDPMVFVAALANKDITYGHRLTIANYITQQRTLQALIEKDVIKKTKWYKRFGKLRHRSIPKAYKDLKKHFGAYALRDAEFVKVSMTCGDRDESALIVNTMVDMFLSSHGRTTQREITDRLTKYKERLQNVQVELDAAESALSAVRKDYADLEIHTYRDTLTAKLDNLEFMQNELLLEIGELQATVQVFEGLATEDPFTEQIERAVEGDAVMVLLAQQLALQEAILQGRLTKFGENHRVVRETQDVISEIREKRRIRQAEMAEQFRQANLQAAQDALVVRQERFRQLEELRGAVAEQKSDFDLKRAEYEKVVSIRDERRQMLDSIKEAIEKGRMMHDDPRTPKVQKVGEALPPLRVSSPMWYFYFPGGTVLGFMFGVGLAFLIELLNDLVRTPRDVSRYLHIPLLGVIPHAAEDGQVRDVDLCHVVRKAPYSIISESYRRLRTNLKLSGSAEALKALLVSSGMAGDGRTTVAVNLATTFVAENMRVLLIDANFWRPSLHTALPKTTGEGQAVEQSDRGLSNLLMGQCGQHEVIRPGGIEGLDIIDSGPLPSNPAELLGGMQMEQLVKQQRESYDYVIVDGPPVLLVSASKMLARVADGTVLVFNACTTRRGTAQRTIRELKEVNATIVGCVLFAVQAMKGGYFREQFKSYRKYQKLQLAHSV
jgi:succinoglycan biosynthesis transport protein ExoP